MGRSELLWGIATAAGATAALALLGLLWGDSGGDDEGGGVGQQQQQQQQARMRRRQQASVAAAAAGDVETLVGSADMLVQRGRFAEAETQYLAALQAVRAVSAASEEEEEDGGELGASAADRTALAGLILHELGALYKFTDRLADADAAFGRSVHAFRAALGSAASAAVGAAAEAPLCRSLCDQAEVKTLRTRLVGGGTADGAEAKALLREAHALAGEAVALLEKRLLAASSSSSSSPSSSQQQEAVLQRALADALKSMTQVHMFSKEWVDAEKSIRRCIGLLAQCEGTGPEAQQSPAAVTAKMWLSQIMLGQDRPDAACDVCRELAVTHRGAPEEAYFLRYLGEVLTDAERYDEAVDALQRSLALYHARTPEQQEQDEQDDDEPGREGWAAVNDLATLYEATGKAADAERMLTDMRLHMRCTAPETSSRFLRTLQCGVRQVSSSQQQQQQHVLFINVLVRERHSRKVPVGSFLVFCFQAPGETEAVPSGLEKEVEADTKTVAVASPGFPGTGRDAGIRTVQIRVLAPDHATLLSTHTQLVRPDPADPSARLVLD